MLTQAHEQIHVFPGKAEIPGVVTFYFEEHVLADEIELAADALLHAPNPARHEHLAPEIILVIDSFRQGHQRHRRDPPGLIEMAEEALQRSRSSGRQSCCKSSW